jgi:hypothetical protein
MRNRPARPALLWVVVVAVLLIAGCGGSNAPSNADRTAAVNAAGAVYDNAKSNGIGFRRGPCLAEKLPGLSDWVVDVAHDPRQPVDDVPTNQCARYRSGQAHHFVELDPAGNLIRAR